MSDAQASSYGEQHAPVYDRIYRRQHTPDAAVAALAAAAGADGAVLEMGVGTGRLAIPLAALGISVDGLEGSPAMLEQMRRRPGGDRVGAFQADLANFELPRRDYAVAVCAVSTLFMLPTAQDQQRCLVSAARHLGPGGRLMIEAFQVDPSRFDATGHRTEERPTDDGSRHTVVSTHDALDRSIRIRHTLTDAAGHDERYEVTLHYLSTAQLDEMAVKAGLMLMERWHDWGGGPATARSTDPISISQPVDRR
ncbi:MAG: class I SAM-dependent methyltransferase [Actinomycetota bacterium]|nr:class I SAM-dependent methyltransferase [Actinomycetota bacterium]